MKGIIYWSPALYELSMRAVLGRAHRERLRAVADLVPEGAEVVELCAGTFSLYRAFLKAKRVRYTGFDLNAAFVRHARARGVDARVRDVAVEEIPEADVVILQESLYQFIPNERRILERVLRAARHRAIIAERTGGLSQSRSRLLAELVHITTDPGSGRVPDRFRSDQLRALFAEYDDRLETVSENDRQRELIGVFRGFAPPPPDSSAREPGGGNLRPFR